MRGCVRLTSVPEERMQHVKKAGSYRRQDFILGKQQLPPLQTSLPTEGRFSVHDPLEPLHQPPCLVPRVR